MARVYTVPHPQPQVPEARRGNASKRILPMFGKNGLDLPNIGKSIRRARDSFCQTLAKIT
jgi:hypothetical protein